MIDVTDLAGRKLGSHFADGFIEAEDALRYARDHVEGVIAEDAVASLKQAIDWIDEATAKISEMKFAYALSNLRKE